MEFFDKLGGTISSKSKQVAQKAKDMAEISKLNGQIVTEEDKIKNAYLAIGKLYYDECYTDPQGAYVNEVEIIKNSNKTIEGLKDKVNQLKGIQSCPNCGAEVDINASFCTSCGNKLEIVELTPIDTTKKQCPNCHQNVEDNDVFCIHCGTRVKEENV